MDDVFTESTPTIVDCSILEAAKENIQPIAAGRRVTALAGILATPHAQREAALASARKRFQTNIAIALADFDEDDVENSTDPLEAYDNFVRWTVENYPHGQSSASNLLPLLEEATRALKDHAGGRWRQDERYLKLWAMYAGYVERPEIVWRFLLANDIGTSWAIMYEGMATVLERAGRKTEADEIYLLGIARNASPLERLQSKHREFQKRMMAGIFTANAGSPPTQDDSPPPVVPKRKVLGESTKPTSRPSAATDESSASNPAPPAPRPNARMQVFVDGAEEQPTSPSLPSRSSTSSISPSTSGPALADRSPPGPATNAWPELGTRASRVKENTREVSKMSGTTLKQPKSSGSRSAVSRAPSGGTRTGFSVFVDPEGEKGKTDMPPPAVPVKVKATTRTSATKAGTSKSGSKTGPPKAKSAKKPSEMSEEAEDNGDVAEASSKNASFVPFKDEPDAEASTKKPAFVPFRDEAVPSASFTPFRDETLTPARTLTSSGTPAPDSVMKPKTSVDGTRDEAPLASSEAEALRKDPLKNYK